MPKINIFVYIILEILVTLGMISVIAVWLCFIIFGMQTYEKMKEQSKANEKVWIEYRDKCIQLTTWEDCKDRFGMNLPLPENKILK